MGAPSLPFYKNLAEFENLRNKITNRDTQTKMTSLPVKTLYQRIGEQVEAQPSAVVHIENSIYLRSKAITSDRESLHDFLSYAISSQPNYTQYASTKYDLQIKQNNNGVQYAIATFVIPQIARDLIEEHPPYFREELIHITSAYLQPRRNGGQQRTTRYRNQQKRTNRWDSTSSSGSSFKPSQPSFTYSPPSTSPATSPVFHPQAAPQLPPQAPPPRQAPALLQPSFQKDVAHLAEKLKHINFEPKPKSDNLLLIDSLLDSGNCSPAEDQKPILYPFGLCFPDYRSYKTISRCSSFSKSKDEVIFDSFQQCNDYPKFY